MGETALMKTIKSEKTIRPKKKGMSPDIFCCAKAALDFRMVLKISDTKVRSELKGRLFCIFFILDNKTIIEDEGIHIGSGKH